jgi:hypothetical protein
MIVPLALLEWAACYLQASSQSRLVLPNVLAKGEADGGTPGPENRKCTPYLGSGPGGTPLDLPLSAGLGCTRRLTTPGAEACSARLYWQKAPSPWVCIPVLRACTGIWF